MDILDEKTRGRMMAAIKGRDTQPERMLRSGLHRQGFRFRLHVPGLPGRPDLAFPRRRAVIFVHGCFWHRHAGCRYTTEPASRQTFWQAKFAANVTRDIRNNEALRSMGWRVATIWACGLKGGGTSGTLKQVADWLRSDRAELVWPPTPTNPGFQPD
ncbi:MAG: very short patch repair endonuclease [Candidatus Sericytochromatia bacterium]|nr:very short patch repair endonuclease [Candidatus Sericytochromatia bacterium]